MPHAVKKQLINSSRTLDLEGEFARPENSHYLVLSLEKLPELLSRTENRLTRYVCKPSLLFFVRSSELHFARWGEIDWQQKLWIILEE